MNKFLALITFSYFISFGLLAQEPGNSGTQNANCTQVLRLARAVYEQGRLHELQPLLEDCIAKPTGVPGNFTVQEKVDALRLLCLSYIYLEEPERADNAMLQLLQTDHFFELNATDPAEFKALYRTFRTIPVFSWGAKIAGNLNMIHLLSVYPGTSGSQGNGTYKPGVTFSGAAFIERNFFPKAKEGSFFNRTLLRADIFYMIRGNKLEYTSLYKNALNEEIAAAKAEGKLSTSWININVMGRYRFHKNLKSKWDPYVGLGASTSFLLSAKLNLAKYEWRRYDGVSSDAPGNSYSGPSVDIKSAYNAFPIYGTAMWGVNTKFGELYFNFEARYQYGFGNVINGENRTVPDLLEYGITLNDYRQSNIVICAGVTIPYFKPKKLTSK